MHIRLGTKETGRALVLVSEKLIALLSSIPSCHVGRHRHATSFHHSSAVHMRRECMETDLQGERLGIIGSYHNGSCCARFFTSLKVGALALGVCVGRCQLHSLRPVNFKNIPAHLALCATLRSYTPPVLTHSRLHFTRTPRCGVPCDVSRGTESHALQFACRGAEGS